jgi:hypothetical protein
MIKSVRKKLPGCGYSVLGVTELYGGKMYNKVNV